MMKSIFPAKLSVLVSLVLVSCGGNGNEPSRQDEGPAADIPEYTLVLSDSFGVELGDSLNMLGETADFCHHPDGSVLILDRGTLNIRVLSPGLDSPRLISREGDGPGELRFPQSICALDDGRILVSDEARLEILSFDITGDYKGSYFTTDRYTPHGMCPVDSSSFVGSMLGMDMGEEINISLCIARFDESSEPSVIYHEWNWVWPCSEVYTEAGMIDFLAGRDGIVFVVPDNTVYAFQIFSHDGERIQEIERDDVGRIVKTDEEIRQEKEEFEEWAQQDQAYTGGFEPASCHTLISLIGVDEDGHIWIQRNDSDTDCLFDIWSPSGDLLYTARLSRTENDSGLFFRIDQSGLLALTDESADFTRIYSLSMNIEGYEVDL